MLFFSPCFIIRLTNTCSMILQQTLVREFSAWYFCLFLKAGVTLAVRQCSGTFPVASDFRKIMRSSGAISSASPVSVLSALGPRLSGPGDLFGLRSFGNPMIPFSMMFI